MARIFNLLCSSILLHLASAASVSAPVPGAPDNFTVLSHLKHFTYYYCPFEVDGALAEDLSQLVVTYDLSKPGKAFPGPGHEMDCLFFVHFMFSPPDNNYRFTAIEHSGTENIDLQVSSQTVTEYSWAPVSIASKRY